MRKLAIVAAGFSLAASGAPALAQDEAAPSSEEQQQRAVRYLQVLIGGLQSENVGDDVKGILVGCLYGNTLRHISDEVDKVIAANPQLDRTNNSQMLGLIARICGYEPPAQASPAPNEGR